MECMGTVQRVKVSRCNMSLSNDRTCCHVEGHEAFQLRDGGPIRHSHTWQPGFNRFASYGSHILDMETGEVAGDSWSDFNAASYRSDYDPIQVLKLYGIEGIEMELIEIIADGTLPSIGYQWSYRGEKHIYGVSDKGFSVEFTRGTGEIRRMLTPNERKQVIRSAKISATRAARRWGLKVSTVRSIVAFGE
jgi:hypothetical protein